MTIFESPRVSRLNSQILTQLMDLKKKNYFLFNYIIKIELSTHFHLNCLIYQFIFT